MSLNGQDSLQRLRGTCREGSNDVRSRLSMAVRDCAPLSFGAKVYAVEWKPGRESEGADVPRQARSFPLRHASQRAILRTV